MADGDSVRHGFDDIMNRADVDNLNNAGLVETAQSKTSPKEFLDVMNVDLCGAVRCSQAGPTDAYRGSGAIINITSVAGCFELLLKLYVAQNGRSKV